MIFAASITELPFIIRQWPIARLIFAVTINTERRGVFIVVFRCIDLALPRCTDVCMFHLPFCLHFMFMCVAGGVDVECFVICFSWRTLPLGAVDMPLKCVN